MTDWIKIRNEYINGDISYRKLAEKHNVSFHTLKGIATDEKWFDKRKEQKEKIRIMTEQKTAEKISNAQANRLAKILDSGDKIAVTIDRAISQIDTDGEVDTYKLRQIVQSLKDLKEIISTTQSPADNTSQELARKALIDAIKGGNDGNK